MLKIALQHCQGSPDLLLAAVAECQCHVYHVCRGLASNHQTRLCSDAEDVQVAWTYNLEPHPHTTHCIATAVDCESAIENMTLFYMLMSGLLIFSCGPLLVPPHLHQAGLLPGHCLCCCSHLTNVAFYPQLARAWSAALAARTSPGQATGYISGSDVAAGQLRVCLPLGRSAVPVTSLCPSAAPCADGFC